MEKIPPPQVLANLQAYAHKINAKQYESASDVEIVYESRLNKTAARIEKLIHEEEDLLQTLKSEPGLVDYLEFPEYNYASERLETRLQQLRAAIVAYEQLTPAKPVLPEPDSPLPALLAIRDTIRVINELRDSIPSTHVRLSTARDELAQDTSDFEDTQFLTSALERRIERLEALSGERADQSPDAAAKEMLVIEQDRQTAAEREAKRLLRVLKRFTAETFAPMLAAEELGGPVAGTLLDITEEMLLSGFSAQGKPKRTKSTMSEDKRQRRIDQIWGAQSEQDDGFEENPATETEAAEREMQLLLEELLTASTEGGASTYVDMKRESAASRFLARAAVADLHPRDAMKIRLVDFTRELGD